MFCIITPIFDEAFKSCAGLLQDLKEQTFPNFKHILISNGPSNIIKRIVQAAKDDRFVYLETNYEPTPALLDILVNICKRRVYALENFDAERYFFFDADLLVKAKNFLEVVAGIHDKADVIISKVWKLPELVLPLEPIKMGHIDIANYSFSKNMRNKYKYPIDYPDINHVANDWRFYEQMRNESHYFNDIIYAVKDGRRFYRNLSTKYSSMIRGL